MQRAPDESGIKSGTTDFLIRVNFRQHATWQGEIEWLGEGPSQRRRYFRSLLEMLTLMHEALEMEGRVEAEGEPRSWDGE